MTDYRSDTRPNGMEFSNVQATGIVERTGDRVHVIIIICQTLFTLLIHIYRWMILRRLKRIN